MRYKIGETPVEGAYAGSTDFVTFTVWVTFLIGVGFLVAGIYGRQHWLAIWGGLTIVACASYSVILWLDLLP